ncbi:hypothetical protein MBLNU230_g3367t1 [Neophaeotheca triangularis]
MAAGEVSVAQAMGPVMTVASRLERLLEQAATVKSETGVEPALSFSDVTEGIGALHDSEHRKGDQPFWFSVTETAARDIFYHAIMDFRIDEPGFVRVWNLLDILLMGGDHGKCAPELVCSLLEELLDSQTTVESRTVFDYLESRRERLVARDFQKKHLIFLRSCNELLRRLSRAEDSIFCGRVFFFLFQTFPLGDKSSVNLRGEFHVENTTQFTFRTPPPDSMDVDKPESAATAAPSEAATPVSSTGTPQPPTKPGNKAVPIKDPKKPKEKPAPVEEEETLSNDELYPIFWLLQASFSDPTRLFSQDNFKTFKRGLALTISKFRKTPTVVQTKATDDDKDGVRDKMGQSSDIKDQFIDNYNPKYLTSPELFDLELSDLAFQRHILVQALILTDFLLSLTEKSKKKLTSIEKANNSMLYQYTLNEEDAKWASNMRGTITQTLLSSGSDGRFYTRMVETVLARDKNWVRWKAEGCPIIVREPVPVEQEMTARTGAAKATKPRPVPEKPIGAMDLSFLEEGAGGGIESLKDQGRFAEPSLHQLLRNIETSKLDMEMEMTDEGQEKYRSAIVNAEWRSLRKIKVTRPALLNKMEPGKDLEIVVKDADEALAQAQAIQAVAAQGPEQVDPKPDGNGDGDGDGDEDGGDVAVAVKPEDPAEKYDKPSCDERMDVKVETEKEGGEKEGGAT